MTPYTAADDFQPVTIYDISDPVLGGTAGESNEPIKLLADRTQYLYNRLGSMLGQRNITGAASITTADVFRLLKVVTATNITLSLDPVAGFRVGALLKFKVKISATINTGKAVRILPNGSEAIEDGNINLATAGLYLHDGEEVTLMAADSDSNGTADYWEFLKPKGNFDKVGVDDQVRVQPRNSFIAKGDLSNRADFPRIWAAVSATAIADSTWSSDIRYKAFFSDGNGTTTFRWPDMRGLFIRGLDLSRGLDLERLDALPGGYEADQFKSHNHASGNYDRLVTQSGFNTATTFDNSPGEHDIRTSAVMAAAGGTETRPKNIGFTPVIYY